MGEFLKLFKGYKSHWDVERDNWEEVDKNKLVYKINSALFTAINDLKRPVHVHDVWIDILGRVEGEIVNQVEPFEFAGIGISHDYFDKFKED